MPALSKKQREHSIAEKRFIINVRNRLLSLFDTYGAKASEAHTYNHYFARDLGLTTFLALNYLNISEDLEVKKKITEAIQGIWRFQLNNGKVPHEIKKRSALKDTKRENDLLNHGFYKTFILDGETWLINKRSVDATPLILFITPRYLDMRGEKASDFIRHHAMPALSWMTKNMDKNSGWLSYMPHDRLFNPNQGWMDSYTGVLTDEGRLPDKPVALVEVQALAWTALLTWSDILKTKDPDKAIEYKKRADVLKQRFNKEFIVKDENGNVSHLAHALYAGKQITSPSINQAFCLAFSHDGKCIVEDEIAIHVANRIINNMYDPLYGIQTFEDGHNLGVDKYGIGENYHRGRNGERIYWLMATGVAAIGIKNIAEKVGEASGTNISSKHLIEKSIEIKKTNFNVALKFKSPREQFIVDKTGNVSFFNIPKELESPPFQTFSAMAILDAVTDLGPDMVKRIGQLDANAERI